jgi:hypothetical protein
VPDQATPSPEHSDETAGQAPTSDTVLDAHGLPDQAAAVPQPVPDQDRTSVSLPSHSGGAPLRGPPVLREPQQPTGSASPTGDHSPREPEQATWPPEGAAHARTGRGSEQTTGLPVLEGSEPAAVQRPVQATPTAGRVLPEGDVHPVPGRLMKPPGGANTSSNATGKFQKVRRVGREKPCFSPDEARAVEQALTDQWWGVRDAGLEKGGPSPSGSGFGQYSGRRSEGAHVRGHGQLPQAARKEARVSALTAALSAFPQGQESAGIKSAAGSSESFPAEYDREDCHSPALGSCDGVAAGCHPSAEVAGSSPRGSNSTPRFSSHSSREVSAPISVPALDGKPSNLLEMQTGEALELPVSINATPGSPK